MSEREQTCMCLGSTWNHQSSPGAVDHTRIGRWYTFAAAAARPESRRPGPCRFGSYRPGHAGPGHAARVMPVHAISLPAESAGPFMKAGFTQVRVMPARVVPGS